MKLFRILTIVVLVYYQKDTELELNLLQQRLNWTQFLLYV